MDTSTRVDGLDGLERKDGVYQSHYEIAINTRYAIKV
jgi:hypothetical protein